MSEMFTSPMGPDFNPHTQPMTMFYPDGTNVTMSLADFTLASQDAVKFCITFGAQIGACGMLLIILALLTNPEKRRTVLFVCNVVALAAVIVRAVLQVMYYLGPYYDTYTYMAYDFTDVPASPRYIQVTSTVMSLITQMLIEISLILQVRVVYSSSPKLNMVMTLISCLFGLTAVGLFFGVLVESAPVILKAEGYGGGWLYPTARAAFAGTICFFSFIFIIKLGLAIRRRRILGLRSFGPMQIIFTMGCQTMILPATFAVLENVVEFDGLGSLTSTLVAISLPLSGMWAAAQIDAPVPSLASGLGSYGRVFGSRASKESSYGSESQSSTSSPRRLRGWMKNHSPVSSPSYSVMSDSKDAASPRVPAPAAAHTDYTPPGNW